MHISDAMHQLQTTYSSVSLEEQFLFIETADFPADDRLRFYAPDNEWVFLRSIVSKSYERALQAIPKQDENLDICREEIEKFHKAYFNPARISILDDQRKVRIPLVNIFRYYGLWLCIADNQKPSIVSREQVSDDFHLHINAVHERYKYLLMWLIEKVEKDQGLANPSALVTGLVWLQRVVNIPPSSLRTEQIRSVLELLESVQATELGMNNRMIDSKQQAVSRFRQAILSHNATAELVGDDLPISWHLGEAFETTDWALDSEFSRLARRAMTMSSLRTAAREPSWKVSELPSLEEILNAEEIRSFVEKLEKTSVADFARFFSLLREKLLLEDEKRDAGLRFIGEAEKRLSIPPYVGNLVHYALLTQVVVIHYLELLMSDRTVELASRFLATCNELDDILREYAHVDIELVKAIGFRVSHTWRNWECPWAFAYYFWSITRGEIVRGGIGDAEKLLVRIFGQHGERLAVELSQSQLSRIFSSYAHDLSSFTVHNWLMSQFERLGLIVTDKNSRVPVDAITVSERAFSKNWMTKYDSKYQELIGDKKKWSDTKPLIEEKAGAICLAVLNGQKRNLKVEMKKAFGYDIRRALANRLVFIGLCNEQDDLYRWMELLCWSDFQTMRHFAQDHGFYVTKRGDIWPDSPLLLHETRDWLKAKSP